MPLGGRLLPAPARDSLRPCPHAAPLQHRPSALVTAMPAQPPRSLFCAATFPLCARRALCALRLNSRTSVRRPMAVPNAQPFPMVAGAEVFRMPTFEKKKNPRKQAAGQASGRARRRDGQVRRMSVQRARFESIP